MVRSVNRWCVLGMTMCLFAAAPARGQVVRSTAPVPVPVLVTAAAELGELRGTIRDEGGRPLNGVMVSAVGITLVYDVSDPEGRYAFRGLPPGTYLVRAHLTGYTPPRGRYVQVSAGSQQVWPISMNRVPSADAPAVARAGIGETDGGSAPVTTAPPSGDDADGGEMRWRLSRIRRGVLKDADAVVTEHETDRFEESIAGFRRALGSSARLASAFFDDLTLSGQINLLTTTSFDRPQDLFSSSNGTPRPVAYVSLVAPTSDGEWTMRGSMTEGDIASWILAGSYRRRATATHRYEAGLSYATQRYQGANTESLAAMADGTRNVGELYAYDTWTVSPQLTLSGGGRTAVYAYLDDEVLLSGRVNVAYRPSRTDPLTLRVSAAHRQIAPGAEEFLPPLTGVWLPPERTFSALPRGTLQAERVNHVEVAGERAIGNGVVVAVRAFHQSIDDQMVTLFGVATGSTTATPSHYRLASAGSFEAYGWGVGASREVGAVRATLDYTQVDTRGRGQVRDELALLRVSPNLVRGPERIHDLTATVNSRVAPTATRLMLVYKLNSAFVDADTLGPLPDARFEVQVSQEMPFLDFTGAQWEMLVGVRNLFRSELFDGSVYDELMVVSPPKRVMGGVTVRF